MSATSTTHEARLMVCTSLVAYRTLLDEHGLADGTRLFAERVAENASLLAAMEANSWTLVFDDDESDRDEQYLYGRKRFGSSDEAIVEARALGAFNRTLGWGIGEQPDDDDSDTDEYLDVGAA